MSKLTTPILTFIALAISLASFSQPEVADSLLKEIKKAGQHDSIKATNYVLLGESIYLSQPEEARKYWEKALSIANKNIAPGISEAENITFSKIKAATLNNLAFLFKKDGDFEKSLEYIDQSIKIEQSINNEQGLIQPYNLKASILEGQGKVNDALQYYLKTLAIAEKHKLIDNQVMVLNNIGYLHNQQKNHDKALQYYNDALEKVRAQNNKYFTAILLNNVGKIYNIKNQTDSALKHYEEAASILKEINSLAALSAAQNNIAKIYHKKGDSDKALVFFKKALAVAENINAKENISSILNNIAGIYTEKKDYATAAQFYQQALGTAKSIGWVSAQRNSTEGLSKLYAQSGNYKKAYDHTLLLMQLKDSILNQENSKAVAEMETKYQTEKKQLEIDNLEKERALNRAELEKKNEEVKRQNMQKAAFAGGLAFALIFSLLIYRSYRQKKVAHEIISEQKAIVEHQKIIVEEKNKDITDSINYAKRLQDAILPPLKSVKEHLPESFILYKPKDIVAGDFYWMEASPTLSLTKDSPTERSGSVVFLAAADCTGHGVPGAMVSVVCSNALNRTVKEFGITAPGKILDKVRELVIETFSKSESEVKDGMDISLCSFDISTKTIQWAGANNPLWLLRSNEVIEFKPDKQPIGYSENAKPFTSHTINLQKGDTIYLFTDGYADQFGGEKGKKFKYAKLKELLLSIQDKNMNEQKEILNGTFESWKGNLEQVDDVCIIGVRV